MHGQWYVWALEQRKPFPNSFWAGFLNSRCQDLNPWLPPVRTTVLILILRAFLGSLLPPLAAFYWSRCMQACLCGLLAIQIFRDFLSRLINLSDEAFEQGELLVKNCLPSGSKVQLRNFFYGFLQLQKALVKWCAHGEWQFQSWKCRTLEGLLHQFVVGFRYLFPCNSGVVLDNALRHKVDIIGLIKPRVWLYGRQPDKFLLYYRLLHKPFESRGREILCLSV